MRWINANVQPPPNNVIMREISNGAVIPNKHVWKQTADRIIMDNDYDAVGRNGREIPFTNIEWLLEV